MLCLMRQWSLLRLHVAAVCSLQLLQAAQEKETGRLSATVSLPQIPKAIAKMAAEAKHEIMIEQTVDKRNKAVKAARKEAAAKKIEDKKAAAKALAAKAAKTVGLDSDSA